MTTNLITTEQANAAALLVHIADLIEEGLPAPLAVDFNAGPGGTPAIQVEDEDLPAWLIALDVVAPMWIGTGVNRIERAHFEPGTFDAHPFTLVCCRVTPATEQVTA